MVGSDHIFSRPFNHESISACGEVRCAPTSTAMDKESQARLHPTWDFFSKFKLEKHPLGIT